MNSTNLTQYCFEFPESTFLKGLKTAAFIIVWVLSFSGNLLLVVTVTRRALTTLNILIANIAISDLLLIFLGIPEQILYIHRDQEVGHVINFIMCKFTPFTNGLSTSVSMMSLAVIAVERFQAIVYPLKFKSMQKRRCFVIIAICWLIGILFSSCNLLTFQVVPGTTYRCTYSWEPYTSTTEGLKVYTLTYIVCFIAIPLTIMITLYAVLMYSVQQQNAVVCHLPAGRRRRAKENRNVIFMLVTMLVVFFLSWSPYLIVSIFLYIFYWNFNPPCSMSHVFFLAQMVSYLYTIFHPLIYYCFSKSYKQRFQQILCCQNKLERDTELNNGLT